MAIQASYRIRWLALMLIALPGAAMAGAFALPEQSASGTGTAFAGAATSAEDASTIYYNPAGMTFLGRPEVVNGIAAVFPDSHFQNGASVPAFGQTPGSASVVLDRTAYLGYLYFSTPVGHDVWLGVGINSPFGLSTEYPGDWIGRFQGVKSESSAPTVNPAIAYRFGNGLSIAAGFDVQRFSAELTNAVNYTAIVAQAGGQLGIALPPVPNLEGSARVKGHDVGYGFNIGAIYEFGNRARVGASYRSSISYRIDGDVSFDRPLAPSNLPAPVQGAINQIIAGSTPNGSVHVDLKTPPLVVLSAQFDATPQLTLMADAQWTGWDTIQEVRIVRDSGQVLSDQPYGYHNTWRFAFGGRYRVDPQWALRAGVAFDESPVPDALRSVRLPDSDKTWIAVGAQWRPNEKVTVDVGYAYLFAADADIHYDQSASGAGVIDGTYRAHVQLLNAQLDYRFD